MKEENSLALGDVSLPSNSTVKELKINFEFFSHLFCLCSQMM